MAKQRKKNTVLLKSDILVLTAEQIFIEENKKNTWNSENNQRLLADFCKQINMKREQASEEILYIVACICIV